jgi:uncharacterized damage-inducible protein DinB
MKRITLLGAFAAVFLFALSFQPATSEAQTAAPQKPEANEMLKSGFGDVNNWITKSADMVPADKYSYKPTDGVRTFGQLVAHVTDSYNYFCAHGAGKKVDWSDAVEKGSTDKETLLPKLKQAVDACNAVYGSPTEAKPLFINIAHTNLHYGNMITYIRMMGMKPPSS